MLWGGGAVGGHSALSSRRRRRSTALNGRGKTGLRLLAVARLHHGAPRGLHLPRAGSGGGSKLRPTCWRSFVRSPHVVGRRRCPRRGKRPGACQRRKSVRYTSRTTPRGTYVTRHALIAKPAARCRA